MREFEVLLIYEQTSPNGRMAHQRICAVVWMNNSTWGAVAGAGLAAKKFCVFQGRITFLYINPIAQNVALSEI